MNQYFIGGLEPTEEDGEILTIDGTDYIVNDKFKTSLRDNILDWGTFLEVYSDGLTFKDLYQEINKILYIKDEDSIKDIFADLVKKIYYLPADAHIACMTRQFAIYEPVSNVLRGIFMRIKAHYEHLVERFIMLRNSHIAKHKYKVKTNDWDQLLSKWNHYNDKYNLDSSSVVLLFLNPPDGIKSGIHYKIPHMEEHIDRLRAKVQSFHYKGFCPKVPDERLRFLLQFPLDEFTSIIKQLDKESKFPDYDNLEKNMQDIIKQLPPRPTYKDEITREDPPEIDDIDLIKWYTTKILELRKQLLPAGTAMEKYYIDVSKELSKILELLEQLHI